MSALQSLRFLLNIDSKNFSKEENFYLEASLLTRICEELKEVIRKENQDFFSLMKFGTERENAMLEANFICYIIKDILSSEEYNLAGIAYYADTPEDVIYDIAIGKNISPSLSLSRKIIELHRSVRPELYQQIADKIKQSSDSSAAA